LTGARRLGFWKGGATPEWIKVIEKFQLEPKKNLYLIKVVGRYFVMATSEQGVVPVTELNAGEGEKIEGKG
jgi:flagellar biogenesis protein FliO